VPISSLPSNRLGAVDDHPLAGIKVVVTRASDQASSLADALQALGAEVVLIPSIAIVDPADGGAALRTALADLDRFDWLVVTSANGAARVASSLPDRGALGTNGVRVAAIGPGTASALADHGIVADLVPERFVAEALLDAFPRPSGGRGAVLLAQAAGARRVLADGLARAGWQVEVVEAYRTVHPPIAPDRAELACDADVATFTSASSVGGFMAAIGERTITGAVVCIGPITAEVARSAGLSVDAVADPHTIDGLVDAVVALVAANEV
jgi:uroporphyrinogen-III synthase